MSRVSYDNFEKGQTRDAGVFEVTVGKILLVEDVKYGGFTSFFKPDIGVISEGNTKETAVINLLETYNTVLSSGNIKLNIKKKE
jgi:hypothetical protein